MLPAGKASVKHSAVAGPGSPGMREPSSGASHHCNDMPWLLDSARSADMVCPPKSKPCQCCLTATLQGAPCLAARVRFVCLTVPLRRLLLGGQLDLSYLLAFPPSNRGNRRIPGKRGKRGIPFYPPVLHMLFGSVSQDPGAGQAKNAQKLIITYTYIITPSPPSTYKTPGHDLHPPRPGAEDAEDYLEATGG